MKHYLQDVMRHFPHYLRMACRNDFLDPLYALLYVFIKETDLEHDDRDEFELNDLDRWTFFFGASIDFQVKREQSTIAAQSSRLSFAHSCAPNHLNQDSAASFIVGRAAPKAKHLSELAFLQ